MYDNNGLIKKTVKIFGIAFLLPNFTNLKYDDKQSKIILTADTEYPSALRFAVCGCG